MNVDAVRANQNLSFNTLARHAGSLQGPFSNDTIIAIQGRLKCVIRQFGSTSLFEY